MTRLPVLDLLTERETAAGVTVERLREQIGILTDQLTTAETELPELAITRKTLLNLTGHADPAAPADATVASPPTSRSSLCSTPPLDRCAPRTSAVPSTPASPPRTPKGSEPSSNASSPARS
ncbi:hypothetical protein NKG94_16695 [Micromonospora sp. M12]